MPEPYQDLVAAIAPNLGEEQREEMRREFEQLFYSDMDPEEVAQKDEKETTQTFLHLWNQSNLPANERLKQLASRPEARLLAIVALGWLGESEDVGWVVEHREHLQNTQHPLELAIYADVADQICRRYGREPLYLD